MSLLGFAATGAKQLQGMMAARTEMYKKMPATKKQVRFAMSD